MDGKSTTMLAITLKELQAIERIVVVRNAAGIVASGTIGDV